MGIFHVYRKKKDGSLWHITSINSTSLKQAIIENAKTCFGSNVTGSIKELLGWYIISGITKDTGHPYDASDFPVHIQKKIAKIKT